MQGQGFPSSFLQPARRWPSPQEGGEPQQVGGGGDLGTVVRMQENNSKWVREVIMDHGKVGEGGDLGHCGQNSEGSLGRVEGTQA